MVEQTFTIRVVRHEDERGRWESVFRDPHPRLAGIVAGPYQGWTEHAHAPVRMREVAGEVVPLILNLGPPFGTVDGHRPNAAPERFSSFAAGLYDTYVVVESTGRSVCMQVNFTPTGMFRVLGVPMDALGNRTVELADLLGAAAAELTERLAGAPTWAARSAMVDAFIADRVGRSREPARQVEQALVRMRAAGGRVQVATLAREVGWSRKQLAVRFREQVGLPPATLARVIRFRRAVDLIRRGPARWTDVALGCGYYDQAHFNRDFRELAGITPAEFLRGLMPEGTVSGA